MSMVNEAEAVNAQRDAHMAGALERRIDGCPHGRFESAGGMWRCTICGALRTGVGIPVGAVNALRDAHTAGGSVLERRVRSLGEMRREGEMATQMDNILDTSMRLGGYPRRGGCGHGEDRHAGRISELERQRDAAIRAFDAEHALRLDVEAGASAALAALTEARDAAIQALDMRDDALTLATLRGDAWRDMVQPAETERDAARSDSAEFRWLHGHTLNRINAPSPWGRILPWLRGKDGR